MRRRLRLRRDSSDEVGEKVPLRPRIPVVSETLKATAFLNRYAFRVTQPLMRIRYKLWDLCTISQSTFMMMLCTSSLVTRRNVSPTSKWKRAFNVYSPKEVHQRAAEKSNLQHTIPILCPIVYLALNQAIVLLRKLYSSHIAKCNLSYPKLEASVLPVSQSQPRREFGDPLQGRNVDKTDTLRLCSKSNTSETDASHDN